MKKVFIAIVLFLPACHNQVNPRQLIAEAMVKKYMKKKLAGESNYETVTFSGIHESREGYPETKEGQRLNAEIKLEDDSLKRIDVEGDSLRKNRKENLYKIKMLDSQEQSLGQRWVKNGQIFISSMIKYKGRFKGYRLSYTYKITDNLSNNIYHKSYFQFDPSLSKITMVKDTVIDAQDITWR